jgi:hypothetical protein
MADITLATFETNVRSIINRGTKYDTEITNFTRQSARWIERNASLKYMECLEPLRIIEDDEEILFNTDLIKSIIFMRLDIDRNLIQSLNIAWAFGPDDRWFFLKKGDPRDFIDKEKGIPSHYWLGSGNRKIKFNRPSVTDFDGEIFYNRYSDWPTDTTKTHWLLNNAEDILLAQVMILMAPVLRNPRLVGQYRPIRDEAIRTMMLAEEETRWLDGSHIMQVYTG